jgi:hypothetical protein
VSNLHHHARAEFRAAGWLDEAGNYKDEMQQAICEHVLKLLDVFADEGHSGSSAPYAIGLFEKLAMFKPLVPLTGEDWEWSEVSDGRTNGVKVHQNKRCSHVFKQSDRFDGQAYDIEGIVFYDWYERPLEPGEPGFPGTYRGKSHYTCSDSLVPITFPYTPKTEYIERPSE